MNVQANRIGSILYDSGRLYIAIVDNYEDIGDVFDELIEKLRKSDLPEDSYEGLEELYENRPDDILSDDTYSLHLMESLTEFRKSVQSMLNQTHKLHLNQEERRTDSSLLDIPDDIKEILNDFAAKDRRKGSECLVRGYPTAAAMLYFRSTEEMLRELHKEEKENRLDRSWRRVINSLHGYYESEYSESERAEKDLDDLKATLDSLRERRNTIAHPEQRVDREEAERIYEDTERAIRLISRRLDSIT
ncbi:MAG: hypothetical protein ABEJ83_05760 [Candidatus Nanohaloarchaea archaeon]